MSAEPVLMKDDSVMVINGLDTFEAHVETLEYSLPRTLVYTWIANWKDQPSPATEVAWGLSASQGRTHRKVTHRGRAKMPGARKDDAGGWKGVIGLLRDFLEKRGAE